MFTKEYFIRWLKAAGMRAIKTFAQSFVSLITVGSVISEINWGYVLSVSTVAAICSIATSIKGLPEIDLELEVESLYESEIDKWQ